MLGGANPGGNLYERKRKFHFSEAIKTVKEGATQVQFSADDEHSFYMAVTLTMDNSLP